MLILTRKPGERIVVDGPCEVVVLRSSEQRVKIGVIAHSDVAVARGELLDKDKETEAA